MADDLGQLAGEIGARMPRGPEAAVASVIAEPAGAQEVAQLVKLCEARGLTMAPLGACRTLRYLRAAPVVIGVSLVRMAQVVAYEPEDMTVTVQAGITLAELQRYLAARKQHLPIDPPDSEHCAIGALLAASHAGPMRLGAGTARDYALGIQFAGHGGALVRGGGRVVKNVAGYDLMKLMIGSFGTLGIITEVTLKVLPIPHSYAIALAAAPEPRQLWDAAFALHDRLPLLHLDLLTPDLNFTGAGYLLAVGIGGNRPEIDYQLKCIHESLPGVQAHEGADAAALYRALVDLALPATPVHMQLSVLPRLLPSCLANMQRSFRAHVGSGVAQVALPGGASDAAELRRRAAAALGHGRVLALEPALRESVPIFDLPPEATLNLMGRLKATFDPAGIFNPGAFVGGL